MQQIGAYASSLYLVYKLYKGKISLQTAARITGFSIPTILKARRILLDSKLIKKKSANSSNVHVKEFEVVKNKVLNDIKYPSSSNSNTLYITISNTISNTIYKHKIYKNLSQPILSKRIMKKIQNLIDHGVDSSEKAEAMCRWWLRYKKHMMFNYGIFTCRSIVDEFKFNNKSLFEEKEEKKAEKRKEEKGKLTKHQCRAVKIVLAKKKSGEKLDGEDREVLDKYLEKYTLENKESKNNK